MYDSSPSPVLLDPALKPIDSIVCFSHLRWDFVFQRPHHLLARAARNHRVFFLEEPVPAQGAARVERAETPQGVTVLTPAVPASWTERQVLAFQRALVSDLAQETAGDCRVAWYYTPMALPFGRGLGADLVVYDNMDELSAFRGASPRMLGFEERLLGCADLVFTGGQSLFEAKRHRHPNIHAFASSIDAAHFAPARAEGLADPSDQAAIPRPRLGFFGVIDERLDVELVAGIADLRPDWQLVMIGPTAKIDPSSLPRRLNIHWLGGKSYGDLPGYLAGWDVGLMPFAINEATRFISPTKTPEFLAAGLPVVSTPITDVVRPYGEKGLVEIAADAEGFVAVAERLLRAGRPRDWLAGVDAHLAAMSWDRTWAGMQRLMHRALRQGAERPVRAGKLRAEAARV